MVFSQAFRSEAHQHWLSAGKFFSVADGLKSKVGEL